MANSTTPAQATSSSHDSHDLHIIQQLHIAEFAFYFVFSVLTFCQLIFIILPRLIRRHNTTDLYGKLHTREIRRDRRPFDVLIVLTLLTFIVKFSLDAGRLGGRPDPHAITVASIFMTELADECLFAALFALLACCIIASERWRTDSAVSAIRGTRNGFNIYFVASLLALMFLSTLALVLAVGLRPNPVDATAVALFALSQIHIVIYLILSIYFTLVALKMWNKRDSLGFQPYGFVDPRRSIFVSVDILRRIVMHITPLLCILTGYVVISDILLASIGASHTHSAVFGLVDLVIKGALYLSLIFATLGAGFMSR